MFHKRVKLAFFSKRTWADTPVDRLIVTSRLPATKKSTVQKIGEAARHRLECFSGRNVASRALRMYLSIGDEPFG